MVESANGKHKMRVLRNSESRARNGLGTIKQRGVNSVRDDGQSGWIKASDLAAKPQYAAGHAYRANCEGRSQTVENQVPALLTLSDSQTSDNPWPTGPRGGEATCEIRVEHEALYQPWSRAAKAARKPNNYLNRVSTVHTQTFARHIRLPQNFG